MTARLRWHDFQITINGAGEIEIDPPEPRLRRLIEALALEAWPPDGHPGPAVPVLENALAGLIAGEIGAEILELAPASKVEPGREYSRPL